MAKDAQVRPRSTLRRGCLLLAGTAVPLLWLLTAPAQGATPDRTSVQPRTISVSDSVEAWYASSPVDLCSSPLGCPPEQVPTSPYPADTLHVGVAGGQETARTYLLPDLTAVPYGSTAVSGVMTLPVASGSGDGTQAAETATVKACLATKPVTDGAQGSTAAAPAIDCHTAAAPAYDAKKNVFTLDVTVFLQKWSTGALPYGIALVPDPAKGQPTDAWHVAFNGKKRVKADHIVTAISFTPPAPITGGGVPAPTPTPAPSTPAVPPPSSGVALPPVTTGGQPPAAAPPQVAAPTQPAPVAQPVAFVHPFQYPMAFLAPLALLAAAVFFCRLFTRDPLPMRSRTRRRRGWSTTWRRWSPASRRRATWPPRHAAPTSSTPSPFGASAGLPSASSSTAVRICAGPSAGQGSCCSAISTPCGRSAPWSAGRSRSRVTG
ncbi:MAG: hypothetical protein QOJ03_2968 [Frankiaceae bacterium]|nr:hypothetical protein [Frankiaceae bacterium]